MGSPVKSRNFHLFPDFSGKRHAKTRHVMGSHGISRHSHGKVRTKGGFQLHEQHCIKYKLLSCVDFENLEIIKKDILL